MADIYIKQADAVALCELLESDAERRGQHGIATFTDALTAGMAKAIAERIKEIKPADIRPTIHSRWVWDKDGMDWNIGAWRCEHCKARAETTWNAMPNINPLQWSGSKFCGNCGADMRAEGSGTDV